MTGVLLSVGLVLLLVMVGGVFAGAEMALVSLRDTQLGALARSGPRGQRVAALASNPNRFLAAVQIGVTLCGFMSAAFGEATLAGRLRPVLEGWGVSGGLADVLAIIIITLIVSYFALVLGELAPKRLALQRAERIALVVARPVDRVARLARPAIWLLSRSTNLVVRLLGGDPRTRREAMTEEELRNMVAAHESLSDNERELIDDVFAAANRTVSEVMIPRTEVDFLDGSMTVSRAARIASESPHSRFPVVGQGQDDVIGFAHIRDLMGRSHPAGRATTVADLTREIKALPGTKKVLGALSEMRNEGHHLAVVVDEYGGTDGIVTLEDLIEEVIGDIHDEYDADTADPQLLASGETEVDGLLNLDDFAEATGLTLPPGPYETAAGFVMNALGRLPDIGDAVAVGEREVSVGELDGRRIARVRVAPLRAHQTENDTSNPAASDPASDPAANELASDPEAATATAPPR
ncbi:MAG: hemolysin family protein [Mycobacteriales bacterium]